MQFEQLGTWRSQATRRSAYEFHLGVSRQCIHLKAPNERAEALPLQVQHPLLVLFCWSAACDAIQFGCSWNT